MAKKGIVFLLFVFIMSFIGCGNSVTTSNIPKDIDAEIYKKSVEMLAYTERCFNNDIDAEGEKYEEYSFSLSEIYEKQNRKQTEREGIVSENIVSAGWEAFRYKKANKQDSLDYYKENIKKAKEALDIPVDKDSNEVWDKIKNK